jgi:hypothetical protein
MKTYVSFCKATDDYEIDDEDGGMLIDISTIKKLLQLIRETHPELLENIK